MNWKSKSIYLRPDMLSATDACLKEHVVAGRLVWMARFVEEATRLPVMDAFPTTTEDHMVAMGATWGSVIDIRRQDDLEASIAELKTAWTKTQIISNVTGEPRWFVGHVGGMLTQETRLAVVYMIPSSDPIE